MAPTFRFRKREIDIDIDKAWHGLHFLFTGAAEEGPEPGCFYCVAAKRSETKMLDSHKVPYSNQYQFQSSKKELLERIGRLATNDVLDSFWNGDTFDISFDSCNGTATVTLEERENQTVITLIEAICL